MGSAEFRPVAAERSGDAAWRLDRILLLVAVQAFVANWLQNFKDFLAGRKSADFRIDQVIEKPIEGVGGCN